MAREGARQGDSEARRAPRQPPRKLYKIGEVMHYSGLSRQTVHNYTGMGLIRVAERTPSGHRLYGEDVFERLARIDRLKRHRTLQEVKEVLDELDRASGSSGDSSGEDA